VILESMGFYECVHGLFVGVFRGISRNGRGAVLRALGAGRGGRMV
jgi:hypothetical protein